MASFIDTNYDSVLDLARPLAPALRLVRMGAFRRLARVVGSYFHDERLQRIFSFQSMYAGLAPYEALALYAVITYMDAVEGVVVPEGGMHRMATGLAAAVEKAGVEIRYHAPVTRILRGPGGAVTGVELGAGDGTTAWASAPRRRGGLQRRSARRLPHLARRARRAPGGPPWPVLAQLRAVGGGRQGRTTARERPPQHPLRHASGTRRSRR